MAACAGMRRSPTSTQGKMLLLEGHTLGARWMAVHDDPSCVVGHVEDIDVEFILENHQLFARP